MNYLKVINSYAKAVPFCISAMSIFSEIEKFSKDNLFGGYFLKTPTSQSGKYASSYNKTSIILDGILLSNTNPY
jgi:hypothetical protein